MSTTTQIEWTDASLNPWMGCTPVSAGCAHCYAMTATPVRVLGVKFGRGQERRPVVTFEEEALKLNRKAWQQGRTFRVFPSLCDWLDDEVPVEMLAAFLDVVRCTPSLSWQLLTKRPQNFGSRIAAILERRGSLELESWLYSWIGEQGGRVMRAVAPVPPANVWVGASVEDQDTFDERIPELLKIPGRVRFLSGEPLLGSLEFSDVTHRADAVQQLGKRALHGIDWFIAGGESGSKARPCDVLWIREIVAQCAVAGIPCFVKQLGAKPFQSPQHDNATGYELPIKHPKGGEPSEWPTDLRVRQFPVMRPGRAAIADTRPGAVREGIRPTGKSLKKRGGL